MCPPRFSLRHRAYGRPANLRSLSLGVVMLVQRQRRRNVLRKEAEVAASARSSSSCNFGEDIQRPWLSAGNSGSSVIHPTRQDIGPAYDQHGVGHGVKAPSSDRRSPRGCNLRGSGGLGRCCEHRTGGLGADAASVVDAAPTGRSRTSETRRRKGIRSAGIRRLLGSVGRGAGRWTGCISRSRRRKRKALRRRAGSVALREHDRCRTGGPRPAAGTAG